MKLDLGTKTHLAWAQAQRDIPAKTGRIANGGWYSGCGENRICMKAFRFDFTEKLTEGKFLCKEHKLPFTANSAKSVRGRGGG